MGKFNEVTTVTMEKGVEVMEKSKRKPWTGEDEKWRSGKIKEG